MAAPTPSIVIQISLNSNNEIGLLNEYIVDSTKPEEGLNELVNLLNNINGAGLAAITTVTTYDNIIPIPPTPHDGLRSTYTKL